MKIQAKQSKTRKFLYALIAIIVIIGAGTIYAAIAHVGPFAQTQSDSSSNLDNPSKIKTDTQPSSSTDSPNDNPSSSDQSSADHTPKQYEESPSTNSTSSGKLSGVINYSSVSNDKLSIRTTIKQKLTSGTCALVLTNATSGKTVKDSASIVANPSSSTCEGFDIPTSKLGSGTWNIIINLTSGGRHGSITGTAAL